MQIVIDIDENVFTRLFDNGIQDNEIATDDICEMARALRLGTPLPEGHGDLIDKGKFKKWIETQDGDKLMTDYYLNALDMQETIVRSSHDRDIERDI